MASRAEPKPSGVLNPACHPGIQYPFSIPDSSVPLLTLPQEEFLFIKQSAAQNLLLHESFLHGTYMPTWCTLSLNPGHLTKESAPRDSSLGVKAALQCLSYFGSWGLAQSWCSKITVRIGEGGISKPTSV